MALERLHETENSKQPSCIKCVSRQTVVFLSLTGNLYKNNKIKKKKELKKFLNKA